MHRTTLAGVAAVLCLFTLAAPGRAAGPKVSVNLAFSGGTNVQLAAMGSPLKGSGAMTNGKVRYPMTVTSGSVSGNYVTLYGTMQGSKVTMNYKLVGNYKTGYAQWTIGNGSAQTGKGSIVVSK